MRQHGFLHLLLNGIIIIASLFVSWTAAFYLMKFIVSSIDWQPHALISFLITALLGFIIFGAGVSAVGPFIQHRENRFFNEMIDALRRVARGDFQVYLDLGERGKPKPQRRHHPFVQLVDSINDMAVNLKAMEEMRQEFVSNVSHEIGTPLTSIGGFAKALKDDKLPPELRQRYLTIIETECARLSKLSDNLLKLAALDSERYPLQSTPYRLDRQLTSVILAIEPQWEAKNIDVSLDAHEVELTADEDLMSQAWMNLLTNAIKFTPEEGQIQVSLACHEHEITVSIADNGIGIKEEEQPRIFERFYMADRSRNRSAGGSGLGLSIVQKIVELHGGSISVSSKYGEGTQFKVTLPRKLEL